MTYFGSKIQDIAYGPIWCLPSGVELDHGGDPGWVRKVALTYPEVTRLVNNDVHSLTETRRRKSVLSGNIV